LARRGLRVTPQRLTTWSTIHAGPAHMSIHALFERVAEQMPTATLRTVYEAVSLWIELQRRAGDGSYARTAQADTVS
jgi:Fe2+ or Zn2+ uptake regulation protein